MKLDKFKVPYFIADIASNHDGSLKRAKKLMLSAKLSGANAVKFQHFKASTILNKKRFDSCLADHQEKWKKSVYETYKDAEFDLRWTPELAKYAKEIGVDFLITPYDVSSLHYINNYVDYYKIGSGDLTYFKLLDMIGEFQKPVLVATGASSFAEVTSAVSRLTVNNCPVAVMQCNTNYSGKDSNFKFINLNVLSLYKETMPGFALGLSDHTKTISTVLGAIALGATIIEKHFTDDNNREGPDHSFAMTPDSWREMVDRSNEVFLSLGSDKKEVEQNEMDTAIVQRRSLCAARDLSPGDIIAENDMACLRPCPKYALSADKFYFLIGKTVAKNIKEFDFLQLSYFEEE